MKQQIITLFKEGKTYNQIVKILECSKSTVSYHLKDIRKYSSEELKKGKIINCFLCGKEVYKKKSKLKEHNFCSQSCRTTKLNENNSSLLVEAGKKSAQKQKNKRRSKNEILFYSLCSKNYKFVSCNESYFNGWDADVILHNFKVAVLWNGVWHYKQIIKTQSLSQIQNRDKIKIKEIINKGYIPYVIKDMGKYNEEFVNKEFKTFQKFLNNL